MAVATKEKPEGAVIAPKNAPFKIYTPATSARYLKFGVYGPSGVGKTTLASTAPNVLYLNIEEGDAALIGQDIDITTVRTYKDVQTVHAYLAASKHNYETVVIDSLSDLHRGLLEAATTADGNDIPQRQNYFLASEQIIRVVRAFRDLPMHVVFVMGMKERTDNTTGQTMFQPDLSGQLATKIPGYVDVLGFMTMEQVRGKPGHYNRGLIVAPGPRWYAKDRTGTLGNKLDQDQLDLHTIIQLVRNTQRQKGEEVVDEELVRAHEAATTGNGEADGTETPTDA